MSNVDINVDRRTDGRTENRTPISHPATSRCDNKNVDYMVFAQEPHADVLRHFWHGNVLINNFPLKFGKIGVIKVSVPALYEIVL